MIVAFSSTILAIPIMIAKLKMKSQNSDLFLASFNEVLLPFLVMNLSVSLGVTIALFSDSLPIKEKDTTGTKKLMHKMTRRILDPQ